MDHASESRTYPLSEQFCILTSLLSLWIVWQMLGVVEEAFVREVIYVDPVNQVTSMASMNLSLSQYM